MSRAARTVRARAGADTATLGSSLHDIFGDYRDDMVHLFITVELNALRPLMIPKYKEAVEPFREIVRRRCSEVTLEVPTPPLRAAVRGALYLFRPDVPVRVQAPQRSPSLHTND